MKKLFLLILMIGTFSFVAEAQNYRTGLGARLGPFNGITVKHFVSPSNAIEGIASFRWRGFTVTGLYEWQRPINGAAGLDYFLGIGGHISSVDPDSYWKYYKYDDGPYDHYFTVIGVDFIAGLEYTFAEVPFNVGLDWKPAINFGGYRWWADGLALSIRYTIK